MNRRLIIEVIIGLLMIIGIGALVMLWRGTADDAAMVETQLAAVRRTATQQAQQVNITATDAAQQIDTLNATLTRQAADSAATATVSAEQLAANADTGTAVAAMNATRVRQVAQTATQAADAVATRNVQLTQVAGVRQTLTAQNAALQATIAVVNRRGLRGDLAPTPPEFTYYESGRVALALPRALIGADLADNPENVTTALRQLGAEETIDWLTTRNPATLIFYAVDTRPDDSSPRAVVAITREAVPADADIFAYVETVAASLPPDFTVQESRPQLINGTLAARLVVDRMIPPDDTTNSGETVIRQVQYVFKETTNIWIVTYSAPLAAFEALQTDVETSIQTFRVRLP